jgi:leucyl aminopeptidase (aminopeptidase T)
MINGILHVFEVRKNLIVCCTANGADVDLDELFGNNDPACRNIAECAPGVNEMATVIGFVLQDEKVLGFHWARGRSEHLGGSIGPAQFTDPKYIVHQDYVYPIAGAVITVKNFHVLCQNLNIVKIIDNGLFMC